MKFARRADASVSFFPKWEFGLDPTVVSPSAISIRFLTHSTGYLERYVPHRE
jgi:hypothetical protein